MAIVVGLLPWVMSVACRPGTPSTPRRAAAETISVTASPADAVRLVNALRRGSRLREMGLYVAPDRRQAVIELVRAVDQLMMDNQALQQRFRQAGCGAVGTLFDRSEVANIIGVFSMDVEVIEERRTGGSAVVTVQVGRRLPLDRIDLQLQDDRWVIQPDPPIRGLADELRNLGAALRRVGEAVTREEMTTARIAREMEFWQQPVMKRIAQLVEKAEQARQSEPPDKPQAP
jgi:hypothetical protein